ncbi:GH32 C-terminal domain-containing protein [Streptomyces sp. Li-HN-5-11]|uniref:GH32 C-terminal domain-containing protein n=1 Tax=Streptomyces sp. Li-HN-5-11 TaxID=3075432 RepID=UPI0028AC3DEC|nr:GH32 C-terminal domain-containing protein [Streptomyces sp. Li-HN-5-11]WNM33685.1 GH32 C-terminal domain-containing protein [Streptomyces sp. Li-HN-5-11]
MSRTTRPRRRLLAALAVLSGLGLVAASPATAATLYHEQYRPQFHFTPAQNWMNDPNGLIHYKGQYHLFFQYNPSGNTWGNMSWGHAVSTDLVHWKQLPLAVPQDDEEMIFSGSVVLDRNNSTGFGTKKNPPLVAIYTSAQKASGKQQQALAYSTDGGTTWTKYYDNPVLDIGSNNFRDPKVFWYAPTQRWLMAVSLADQHKISFYSSADLKHWTHQSDFGPAGATGGVWECPDLFPLPVDGDPKKTKWVLAVNLNPGGIAGGSGAQYFVGDFDGKKFTSDDSGTYTPPSGTVMQDFESGSFGDWTATGNAFGTAPATGPVNGQQTVTGFEGKDFANSFHGGDASTGALTSPAFTVTSNYINFKVGGGNHPYQPGSVLGDQPAPTGEVLADFEGSTYSSHIGDWTTTGDAFGTGPAQGTLPNQQQVTGYLGHGLVNTFLNGDASTGTLTSPTFTIDKKYLDFLIGGGYHPASSDAPTAVELIVDGKVVRSATGSNGEALNWASWDLSDLQGKQAQIKVLDDSTGGWGHLNLDQIVLSDTQAKPPSIQTGVNLLVDGKVVQSATGADSENLDWASFNTMAYKGKKAQIQIVDANSGGWGHVLADQFTAADKPALNATQRAHWLDYGADFYAANTWNDAPGGRRVMIAWMNNWNYGQAIPTSPWRSADSFPRQLSLQTVNGKVQLIQQPVRELTTLRGTGTRVPSKRVANTTTPLAVHGSSQELQADLAAGTAGRFGLDVRTGGGQRTRIGYDTATGEVYIDRTASGATDFDPTFSGVQRAPLALDGGRLSLHVLVDASSVEVYAQNTRGEQVVLTDQVFPDPSSTGIDAFAEGGTATLNHLQAWQLKSIWP